MRPTKSPFPPASRSLKLLLAIAMVAAVSLGGLCLWLIWFMVK